MTLFCFGKGIVARLKASAANTAAVSRGRVREVGDDPNDGGSLTVIDIGTMLNQRFLLEKELGRGGMGAVYSANDEVLQRKVAIKLLKEQSGEEVGKKLRLEAQIAARLLHDYVVRIYDFGQAEGSYLFGHGGSAGQQLLETVAQLGAGRTTANPCTGGRGARLRASPRGNPSRRQAGQRAGDHR